MARKGLSRELALRIGLAAQALPEIDARQLLDALTEVLEIPLTRSKLETLRPEQLKTASDAVFSAVDSEDMAQAMKFLRGEEGVSPLFAEPQPYEEGDIVDSIRVAVASNGNDAFNGHFASCQGFLIYQLSGEEMRLIDVRLTDGAAEAEDKTAWLVDLIADCHVLYVVSVGGPAAAKVIKAGIHPIKDASGASGKITASEVLIRLQQVLAGSPPPWLAKVLGASPEQRVRFTMAEET